MEEHPELMPLLTVAGGPMRGASFRVRAEPQVIGRAPTADIVVIDDPHLSRRHAEVWLTAGGARPCGTWAPPTAPGSTTGGSPSVERLSDGDVIRLGRTELRFFDPGVALTDPVGLSFGAVPPRRPTDAAAAAGRAADRRRPCRRWRSAVPRRLPTPTAVRRTPPG